MEAELGGLDTLSFSNHCSLGAECRPIGRLDSVGDSCEVVQGSDLCKPHVYAGACDDSNR